jgi:1A family penicillin-binding protein
MGRVIRLLRWCLIGGLVTGLLAYAALYLLPLPPAPAAPPMAESTKILDRQGRVLYDSGTGDGLYTYLPLEQVPDHLKQAVIATEDASFYSHPGVDVGAILRAGLNDLRDRELSSGASTITQQLARNLYFDPGERSSRNPLRKLREAVLALRMERALSKDEILEQFLNRVYFGNLAYGLEAASRTYFGKGARDLDLAESALLAGLLQSAAAYDPFTRMDAAKGRQETVLGRMVEEGYISRAEADAAWAEPLALNPTPFPIEAPHFVAWVRDQLPGLVGETAVARGDLRVYTSLDLDLQRSAQAAVAWHVGELKDRNVTNGAVVALDPSTGQVLAMVGSADYFDTSIDGAVNLALAERQPGSSIKPVVYAAALEEGFTPASPLLDVPTSLKTRRGETYAPNNYDFTFHGVVPLREALASSYNVPAVRILAAIGVERAVEMGRRLGLTSFRDPSRYDLSLTLGGREVRLLDLTAAYAAFAVGGARVDPVAVLRVEDSAGHVLYEAPAPSREQVVSPQTAYLISDILSDNDARAPGFGLNSFLRLDRPAAVKTGTTSDFRDNWTVGYTPRLAVGVWVGNADNSPMRNVSGVDGAAPIWRDVMQTALKGTPPEGFPEPEGIERVVVCLPSGLLPTPYCQRQRLEVFAAGTAPTAQDDYYRPVSVCDATGEAVMPGDTSCPGSVSERVFAFVPLEAIPWAREAGIALPPLPPYSTAADGSARDWLMIGETLPSPPEGGGMDSSPDAPAFRLGSYAALRLTSPADGAVFHLSRELGPEDQSLRIEALPAAAVRYVELYVDGALLSRVDAPPYRAWWRPSAGSHEIRARAAGLDGNETWSDTATVTVLPP